MSDIKLKPCPLCGSDAANHSEFIVKCSKFTCPLAYSRCDIEDWNHRPPESALETELLEMAEALWNKRGCTSCKHDDVRGMYQECQKQTECTNREKWEPSRKAGQFIKARAIINRLKGG